MHDFLASVHWSRPLRFICCLIVCLVTGFSSLSSLADEPDYTEVDHVMVSVEGVYDSGLFQGQDGFIYPELYLDVRQGDFFILDQTFGYDMFVGSRASFSLAITRGDTFLEVDSINDAQEELFYGIEDRDRAIEAGFIYKYRSRVGLVSFEYYKDISDKHDGLRTVFRITRPIPNNEGGPVFVPSLFVNYYSREFNRYYYGVTEQENIAGTRIAYGSSTAINQNRYKKIRDEYKPNNSAQLGVDIRVRYPLTEQLSATGYFSYEDIVGEAFRSPLVEDRKYYNARLGISYNF